MKTKTLLLGIAIATSQMSPLACMERTNCLSIEQKEGEAQLTRYTYQNFKINHFDLRIGGDPNTPYNIDEIVNDLLEQQEYVSSITAATSDIAAVANAENIALIQLRNDFFEKLTKYRNNDATIEGEVEDFEGPIHWIIHQVTYYNKDVKDQLAAFANSHSPRHP
jgi:hypothetical protein